MPSPLMPAELSQVNFTGGFWGPRLDTNRQVTLKVQYDQCRRTGRIDAFKLQWKPGEANPPHQFWDSDVAKWIEASAYSLATHPDNVLEQKIDQAIDWIASAQQPDGYLNVHYTIVEPEKRWKNLRDGHEMYCAGHLMEAAVAYFQATGKHKLMDVMMRMADHMERQFGREDGKRPGYCGHPEVELGLVKLATEAGNPKYLTFAQYLINQRGQQPYYFDRELQESGQSVDGNKMGHDQRERYDYYQAQRPFRELEDLDGHSVRALYLLSGAIDVAVATGDKPLLKTCKRLWRSAVHRRMYITGGVGSRRHGEAFTIDYDLPNETAYAETCANIALAFVAHRLLQIEPSNEYGDVLERALYNGVLCGVSLSGDRFRYANPLTVHTEALDSSISPHLAAARQEWFGCACCPPNVARVLASLGQYVYSISHDAIFVHLFADNTANFDVAGTHVSLTQATQYPWKDRVQFTVDPQSPATFTLALRLPAWCRKPAVTINNKPFNVTKSTHNGYTQIKRMWTKGDRVVLTLPMPIERVRSNALVRSNAGKVALQRGPIVYCLEQIDNGPQLHNIVLPANAKIAEKWEPKLLGGVVTLSSSAFRDEIPANDLYTTHPPKQRKVKIKAVPYNVWGNRKIGEMMVWIRESR
jgi:uncharacterized protein